MDRRARKSRPRVGVLQNWNFNQKYRYAALSRSKRTVKVAFSRKRCNLAEQRFTGKVSAELWEASNVVKRWLACTPWNVTFIYFNAAQIWEKFIVSVIMLFLRLSVENCVSLAFSTKFCAIVKIHTKILNGLWVIAEITYNLWAKLPYNHDKTCA